MNLIEYPHPEFPLHAAIMDGDPWFIAKDVCAALDIRNSRDAVDSLDDDERITVVINDGNRGNPNTQLISESGVFALIFRSRKPEAQAFRRHVTGTILPALRRDGFFAYNTLDQQRIKELEAQVAGARQKLARNVESFWRAQEIDGQYPTIVYLHAIGVEPTPAIACALGAALRHRRKAHEFVTGYARVRLWRRRPEISAKLIGSGYDRKCTWPPEHIAAALRECGIEFREPSTEQLAAAEAFYRVPADLVRRDQGRIGRRGVMGPARCELPAAPPAIPAYAD
ncbi:MAG: Bro-N domain-containing protein [Verrucomicrobia bacterium]|nr:Bro-N domain-containing protein [Verrucomicrobiota bacterium]